MATHFSTASQLLFAALLTTSTVGCLDSKTPQETISDNDGSTDKNAPRKLDVKKTDIRLDIAGKSGNATVTLKSPAPTKFTLEVGDLQIASVTAGGKALEFTVADGKLNVKRAEGSSLKIEIAYSYAIHNAFEGISDKNWSYTWPYFCGNAFPCVSNPADGMAFTMELVNIPEGMTAVYPTNIKAEAASYMPAFAIDAYERLSLGRTTHGTNLSAWYRSGELEQVTAGTQNLLKAFQWLEDTFGEYPFGKDAGSVIVQWESGGGMEHHPYWHVGNASVDNQRIHIHEAVHGWYGNGVRVKCWEDFVLSEGTTSYITARVVEATQGAAAGEQLWSGYYKPWLDYMRSENVAWKVWPSGCNEIDILKDNFFTNAPYIRGAYFYKSLAQRIGAEKVDEILGVFFKRYVGKAADMDDMLAVIKEVSGYDAKTCAKIWLKDQPTPVEGACP